MDKMKDFVVGVCTIMELGCVLGLAGIALKRNNDAYNAERKLALAELDNCVKGIRIEHLKQELKELKGE